MPTLKLTPKELDLLILTMQLAIESEKEFVYCFLDDLTGRPRAGSGQTVRSARARIVRIANLREKLKQNET